MIDVAIKAALAAGELALRYFEHARNKPSYFKTQSASRRITYKPDDSPVTRADVEAEMLIRKIITKKFPDHGIIGEELPPVSPKARYQWVIDPIDGTKSFVRRLPFWSTLLALLENGKPIIGISFSPADNEIYSAEKGKGTFLNGKRQRVSKVSNLQNAYLAHGSIDAFENKNMLNGFMKLYRKTGSHCGFGDSFAYHLLIKGSIDIMVEAKDNVHDIAGPAILVKEAGGRFSDFSGKFSLTSDCGVATNDIL